MKVNGLVLNVNSEQPERLISFYRDTVGLEPHPDMGPGAFNVAGSFFVIDSHSEVHGPTKESPRVLIDLMVDDIDAEEARLRAAGVQFTRSKGEEYWGGIISTFKDPDGNYCQIMGMKTEAAQPA
jgi:predicted enzyme related to lactoylglutathione lyase